MKGCAAWLLVLALVAGCGDGSASAPGVGAVETIAGGNTGDGRRAVETFIQPLALAVDPLGNLFVAERTRIRRVDARSGRITTIAGNGDSGGCGEGGPARDACLSELSGLAVGPDGAIYASEYGARIVRVDASGVLERIAGRPYPECNYERDPRIPDGALATEGCVFPDAIAVDAAGNVYATIAVGQNPIIRIDVHTGRVATIALRDASVDGTTGAAYACHPAFGSHGLALAGDGALVLAAEYAICRVDPESGAARVVAGNGIPGCQTRPIVDDSPATETCLWPRSLAVADDGTIAAADYSQSWVVDPATNRIRRVSGKSAGAFGSAGPLAFDRAGGLFVSWSESWGSRILRHDLEGGGSVQVAGNGTVGICGDGGAAENACLEGIADLVVEPDGDVLLLDGPTVRRIEAATATIGTIAGNGRRWDGDFSGEFHCRDGAAAAVCFHEARRIVADSAGNVFVIDGGDFEPEVHICDRVRRIDVTTGVVTTVFGGGRASAEDHGDGVDATGACFGALRDLVITAAGDLVVASSWAVWRLEPGSSRAHAIVDSSRDPDYPPCGSVFGRTGSCLRVQDIAIDSKGDLLMLSESNLTAYEDVRLLRLDAPSGRLVVVAGGRPPGRCGDGGPAIDACISDGRVLVEATGDVLLAGGGSIRRIDAASGVITTVLGPGSGSDRECRIDLDGNAPPLCAWALALDREGRALYVQGSVWSGSPPRLRRLTLR